MKKFFIMTLALAAVTLTACKNKLEPVGPEEDFGGERIAFSMTDEAGVATETTRAGFTSATRIVLRMRSKDVSTSNRGFRYTRTIAQANAEATGKAYSTVLFDGDNKRYWDDAFGRFANLSVFAIAIPNKSDAGLLSEDKLTNGTSGKFVNGTKWFTEETETETVSWEVTNGQQTTTLQEEQDLTFSNNIQPVNDPAGTHDGFDGVYTYDFTNSKFIPELADNISNLSSLSDGVMQFQLKDAGETTGTGKFNQGHLIFRHALSRLTIHIKKGTGVTAENAFAFAADTDIELKSFPYKGTFDIETATWSSTTPSNISRLAKLTTEAGDAYTYRAQVIPGYQFRENANTAADNVMEFTIDDNTYYITKGMVYKALMYAADGTTAINASEKKTDATGNYVEMERGKNYDLTITVNKKQIEDITATLVDWVTVTGTNMEGDNSYITLSLMDKTSTNCENFDLYRLDAGFDKIYTDQNETALPELYNWNGNYTNKASLTQKSDYATSGLWKTDWFWESNKAFYHFRSVDKDIAIQGASDDDTNDYINVFSGPINNTWGTGTPATANISEKVNDLKYNDYHWGAPMKSTATALTYQTTGSDNALAYGPYIYQAIGSTHSTINIIEQHMMTNVHFVLHTGKKADNTDVAGGQIALLGTSNKATRITMTNFVGNGTVELGRGLVTPSAVSTDIISSDVPVPGATTTVYGTGNVLDDASMTSTSTNYYTTNETNYKVTKTYDYRVVPQALYRGTNAATETDMDKFVGLTIVSPDDNQYYMIKKLYDVTVSAVTTNHGKIEQKVGDQITRWYPGYDYTYHIYLNKKDIEAITCTIVDWVTVTGTNQDITLED